MFLFIPFWLQQKEGISHPSAVILKGVSIPKDKGPR